MIDSAVKVLTGFFYHTRFDRVVFDIADQCVQIGFIRHIPRFESSLPEMAGAIVFAVEPDRVRGVEMLHVLRKVLLRRFDEQVVVVAHQHIAVDTDTVEFACGTEHFKKSPEIFVFHEDIALLNTPIDNVVVTDHIDSRTSWHLCCLFDLEFGVLGYYSVVIVIT